MPEHSVQLAALAATLTSQQVTQDRAATIGGEPDAASRLAGSLNNLSIRLGDLGRREEALAAVRGGRRHLPGAGRGPSGRVPPRSGRSLNNLAVRLAGLGRQEDALAAAEEAVGVYRELAGPARTRSAPTWLRR